MSDETSLPIEFAWNLGRLMSRIHDNMILEGPPGTGKSTYAVNLAQSQPVYRITCHADLLPSELLGHHIGETGGATPWQMGPAARAWLEGGLLILDEITDLSSESKTVCHQILDDKQIAQLIMGNGENIRPHPGFRCIATTNRSAQELPDALLDRFPIRMTIPIPSPEALSSLPDDLRQIVHNSYVSCGWTPDNPKRPLITFREARTFAGLRQATNHLEAARLVWQSRGEDVLTHIQSFSPANTPAA